MPGGVSSPVIISISVAAFIILSVALATILRWARTKPSTQLPPPRPAFLSPYWANQQRHSTYVGRGVSDFYDEERKLTANGSGIFKPFGDYAASNASNTSLSQGHKTPLTDGDRSPNSGVSFPHETGGLNSEQNTPQVRPKELGEISLNSPNPQRQRPASIQFVDGHRAIRPAGSFGALPLQGMMAGGDAILAAAATDPNQVPFPQNGPPSSFSHSSHPSPPRPFSTASRSRHSIAGPPVSQPPPSFQVKHDRRASRMSMYSTYSSSTYHVDPRRASVGSMIRGPPHKSNMQIVLPEPLAPTAAVHHGTSGNGFNDVDEGIRRSQRRHSRVDLWTETNNYSRSRSPAVPLSELHHPTADGRRNRRPSQGSERSSRSLELSNSGQHFVHSQPPPPLPAHSSRSFLSSSRSGTPASSTSALPQLSSAMTTPQRSFVGVSGSSSELGHEKRSNSSEGSLSHAKPSQPSSSSDLKSDNLPVGPPLIEPAKDI